MTCPAADTPAAVVSAALALWRSGKTDTARIAELLGIPEPAACRIIHAEQDRRYRERALRILTPA